MAARSVIFPDISRRAADWHMLFLVIDVLNN
jgi:hypothetical protein